jgi:hypothetical protein
MVCLANHGTGGGTDLRFFTDFSGGFNPKGLLSRISYVPVPVSNRARAKSGNSPLNFPT